MVESGADISDAASYTSLFLFAVIGILFIFIYLVFQTGTSTYVPDDVYELVYSERAVNNCLAYTDPYSGRRNPSVIEYAAFDALAECFKTGADSGLGSLSLRLEGPGMDKSFSSDNYASKAVTERKTVVVHKDGAFVPATLWISVGVPK